MLDDPWLEAVLTTLAKLLLIYTWFTENSILVDDTSHYV